MNAMDRLETALREWKAWRERYPDRCPSVVLDAAEAVVAERVRPDDPEVVWLREWIAPFPKATRARFNALLDRLVGPAPWTPQKGERVRGYRGGCMVEGPYFARGGANEPAHLMGNIGEIAVENIEKLPEPLPPKDGRTP